jgi:NAD(P)-dependent dehydrogenase (short-subunit alcohol dehydrogenase family)
MYLPARSSRGTALVTGASCSIGRAVAGLAAHDVRCFSLANQGFATDLPAHIVPISCDLGSAETIERVIASVSAQTDSLDYLVNVAGIDPKYRLEESTTDIWDSIVDLNLRAYYLLIRGCLPLLRRGRGRSIVNVTHYRALSAFNLLNHQGRHSRPALLAGSRSGGLYRTVSPGWYSQNDKRRIL